MKHPKPVCQSCQNPDRRVNRPRGLCYTCYYSGARASYPSLSIYSRLSARVCYSTPPAEAPPPPPPGTPREERIAIYTARAAAGLRLFEQCAQPEREPGVVCMGCGARPPRQNHLTAIGWRTRRSPHNYRCTDTVCPECYAEYGWWFDDVPLLPVSRDTFEPEAPC